jgi:hypothetical protein
MTRMEDSRRDRIRGAAKEILSKEPQGMRTADLLKKIKVRLQDDKHGVHTVLMQYVKEPDAAIY